MTFLSRQDCSVMMAVRGEVVWEGDESAVVLMQQPSGLVEVCLQ